MLSLVELRAAAAAPSNPPPPRGYLLDVLYNEPSIQVVTDGFILNEDDTKAACTEMALWICRANPCAGERAW